jgi:hypothetical protein
MTPNGAVLFSVLVILGGTISAGRGLVAVYAVVVAFAVTQLGLRALTGLRRAAFVMVPLAVFMLVIWVGIVGRAPDEIAAGVPGSRNAAFLYVMVVAARLFLIVFLLQAVLQRFDDSTPFGFVRRIRAPAGVKHMLILTLSLIETLRNAVGRTHTALIAAGIITRAVSLKNLGSGWILVQTVWLTAITTVTARMRDKWPMENTLARLAPALDGGERRLSSSDWLWLSLAAAAALAGQYFTWFHA